MSDRKLVCIVCPRGCEMTVSLGDGGDVLGVSGNFCRRGAEYAATECTHPLRTVTGCVRCEDGRLLPVKTSAPIPKEMIFECMKQINRTLAPWGAKMHDIVIKNILGCGADVIISGE